MHNFKMAVRTTVFFLFCVGFLSVVLIESFYYSKPYYYQDSEVRNELSGTLNYIICGASHALRAFEPQIIDNELGVNSYNLSGAMMSMHGRYALLKKEIERNPIETVVFEVSYNTLTRDRESDYEGNYYELARWDSLSERVKFLLEVFELKDYGKLYYNALNDGVKTVVHKITGFTVEEDRYGWKGYYPWTYGSVDLFKTDEELASICDSEQLSTQFVDNNLKYLNEIITLCKTKDIQLILVATPLSKQIIYTYDNLDYFSEYYEALASEHNLKFYDYSLLKDKDLLFPDKTAFLDHYHLTDKSAAVFSKVFSEHMRFVAAGADISCQFYNSYNEMKRVNNSLS